MQESRFDLSYPDQPDRMIRGRVVAPGEDAGESAGESAGEDAGAGPWVMLLHGFKGYMDWSFLPLLAHGFAECGITSVRFNTSGSGVGADLEYYSDPSAFEKDTYSRQLEDIARVRQEVESGRLGPLDPEQGLLVGHSRGGGMGLLHAADFAYRGVVTWAAIADPIFFEPKVIELWKKQGYLEIPNTRTGHLMRMGTNAIRDVEENRKGLDIVEAAKRVQAPSLVIHGTQDETVSLECAERISAALPNGTKRLIEGGTHTFGAGHPLKSIPDPLGEALALTIEHACLCLGLEME